MFHTAQLVSAQSVGNKALVSMGDDVEALSVVKIVRSKYADEFSKNKSKGAFKRNLKESVFKNGRESLVVSCAEVDKAPTQYGD